MPRILPAEVGEVALVQTPFQVGKGSCCHMGAFLCAVVLRSYTYLSHRQTAGSSSSLKLCHEGEAGRESADGTARWASHGRMTSGDDGGGRGGVGG